MSLSVNVTNYGRTPALLKSHVNAVSMGDELDPSPNYGVPNPLRYVIAPSHWFGLTAPVIIPMPAEHVAKIDSGEWRIWIP